MARSHRLCLITSRDHGLGLPDGYRTSIIRVLVDIDLEIFVVAVMFVYYRGSLGERVVLMMKMLTQRWATVRWNISPDAIMRWLVVEKNRLGNR